MSALRDSYDVIVVGSGYGGGVAASRLARSGLSVCVLERGREYPVGAFPRSFADLRREVQVSGTLTAGRSDGLFDLRLGKDINVLRACGLGGGSLINAGVAIRPRPWVFQDGAWPAAIAKDASLLDIAFARARQWLGVQVDPSSGARQKAGAIASFAKTANRHAEDAEVTVAFAAGNNSAGGPQAACTGCGDCMSGCNVGAKVTVADSYLEDARRHGAQIFCQIGVERISADREGSNPARSVEHATAQKWRVHLKPDSDSGNANTIGRTISARYVVLAAGSLGSTEILLRSRSAELAFSDRLGHRFSANADAIAIAYNTTEEIGAIGAGDADMAPESQVGATVTNQIRFPDEAEPRHEVIVQGGALPSGLKSILPLLMLRQGDVMDAARAFAGRPTKGAVERTLPMFAVGHDMAGGRIELADGLARISWIDAATDPGHLHVQAALKEVCRASGGKLILDPLAATPFGGRPFTAHPLGGCAMAEDKSLGVVDHEGRVFDPSGGMPDAVHTGLYVVDGAIMPRALGANPLLSITAMAERAMILFAARHGTEFSADPLWASVARLEAEH